MTFASAKIAADLLAWLKVEAARRRTTISNLIEDLVEHAHGSAPWRRGARVDLRRVPRHRIGAGARTKNPKRRHRK